jgi:tetratricopeptide (TPR) repeat protein
VQPGEAIGTPRARRELGDAERRRVRDEDRLRLEARLEVRIGLPLVREVLDDRLDDEVAVGERLAVERPADALPFLLALREKRRDDLEVLADLVRAYLRLGDRDKALTILEELDKKAPRAIPAKQTLADTLYQSGDYDVAGMIYGQILRVDPNNGFALVGTARVAIQSASLAVVCALNGRVSRNRSASLSRARCSADDWRREAKRRRRLGTPCASASRRKLRCAEGSI